MSDKISTFWFGKYLIRSVLLSVALCTIELLCESCQPVYAESGRVVIDISVFNQIVYTELTAQAELLVGSRINREFSQNADLLTIQVVVMGDRNGELIPVLTTTVSRAQWQANPQVNTWTRYHRGSHALLQRHETAGAIASVSSNTATNFRDRSPQIQTLQIQIDAAYDAGQLTGETAQEYLGDLD